MTKNEYNLSVARLHRVHKKATGEERQGLKNEFVRLYRIDKSFEYLNHKNLLRMLSMNLSLQAVPFHQFGLFIESEKL